MKVYNIVETVVSLAKSGLIIDIPTYVEGLAIAMAVNDLPVERKVNVLKYLCEKVNDCDDIDFRITVNGKGNPLLMTDMTTGYGRLRFDVEIF